MYIVNGIFVVLGMLFASVIAIESEFDVDPNSESVQVNLLNSASKATEDCVVQVDLVLLIDGSHSVKQHNFDIVKNWVKQVAESLRFENGQVQIGVVQYSHFNGRRPLNRQRYIRTEISLGQYNELQQFNDAVDRIDYQGFTTYTAHAINKTILHDLGGPNSRYPDAQRVIILMTDGKATDHEDLPAVLEMVESKGVTIYAVGVGTKLFKEQLVLIAGNREERVFELENFSSLHQIIPELDFQLNAACDCSEKGSLHTKCDPCTRQCTCKPNVEGRRCNKCVQGTWNFRSGKGCIDCRCNPEGSATDGCHQITGQCRCNSTRIKGKKCDKCADGYFGFPECRKCECNGHSETCNKKSGKCRGCAHGRVGDHCERCEAGHYALSSEDDCLSCDCNGRIDTSDAGSCNPDTGVCLKCLENTAGDHCENCVDGYFIDQGNNCQECQCSPDGSVSQSCDQVTGQCQCISSSIEGRSCDRCKDGYYQYPDCLKCQCNGHSAGCDSNSGICSNCANGRSGDHCEICGAGHYALNPEEVCLPCDCSGNIDLLNPNACDPTSGKCLSCLHNTSGDHCENCIDEFFFSTETGECQACQCSPEGSVSQSCDQVTGQCQCISSSIEGRSCDRCKDGYYGYPDCLRCQCNGHSASCDKESGICSDCANGKSGDNCEKCGPGQYAVNVEDPCAPCECNGKISTMDPDACDSTTGKCLKCQENTEGDHCESCKEQYFLDSSTDSCKPCSCDPKGSVSNECSDDGTCTCLPHVVGDYCNKCQDGFYNIDSLQGCQPCNCDMMGTSNTTSCHQKTGRCPCSEHYTGMKCAECTPGYQKRSTDGRCKKMAPVTAPPTTTTKKPHRIRPTKRPRIKYPVWPTPPPTPATKATIIKPKIRPTRPSSSSQRPSSGSRRPSSSSRRRYNSCGGCSNYRSSCHGRLCRTRWPHTNQQYSARRCSPVNYGCRSSLQNYYPSSYSPTSYYRGYNSRPSRYGLYKSSGNNYGSSYNSNSGYYASRNSYNSRPARYSVYRSPTNNRRYSG